MLKFLLGGGPWPLLILLGIGLAAGAGGAAWVQEYRIDGLRAERDSAQRELKGARDDTARWAAASNDRDRIIAGLRAQLDKITADAQEAELQAIDLIEAAQARADVTEAKLATLRKQAIERTGPSAPCQSCCPFCCRVGAVPNESGQDRHRSRRL